MSKIGHLVLGRRAGQSIKIGKDILVTIASNSNGFVRIAIKAPRIIKILRTELEQRDLRRDKRVCNLA